MTDTKITLKLDYKPDELYSDIPETIEASIKDITGLRKVIENAQEFIKNNSDCTSINLRDNWLNYEFDQDITEFAIGYCRINVFDNCLYYTIHCDYSAALELEYSFKLPAA